MGQIKFWMETRESLIAKSKKMKIAKAGKFWVDFHWWIVVVRHTCPVESRAEGEGRRRKRRTRSHTMHMHHRIPENLSKFLSTVINIIRPNKPAIKLWLTYLKEFLGTILPGNLHYKKHTSSLIARQTRFNIYQNIKVTFIYTGFDSMQFNYK